MSGMNLYELNAKFAEMVGRIEAETNQDTGELPENLTSEMDALGLEIEERALQCARYIKNIEAEVDAIKSEAAKLSQRAETLENRSERIEAYLQATIPVGTCYKSGAAIIKWGKSERVTIVDEALIPAEFVKTETITSPMKAEIKAAIKSGQVVSGARIDKFNNIQIK